MWLFSGFKRNSSKKAGLFKTIGALFNSQKRELLKKYIRARRYFGDFFLMSYSDETYEHFQYRVNQYYFNHKNLYGSKKNKLQFCFIPFALKDRRFSALRNDENDLWPQLLREAKKKPGYKNECFICGCSLSNDNRHFHEHWFLSSDKGNLKVSLSWIHPVCELCHQCIHLDNIYYKFRDLKREIVNTSVDDESFNIYSKKINDLVNLELIKHYMEVNNVDIEETKYNIAKAMHFRILNDKHTNTCIYDMESLKTKLDWISPSISEQIFNDERTQRMFSRKY